MAPSNGFSQTTTYTICSNTLRLLNALVNLLQVNLICSTSFFFFFLECGTIQQKGTQRCCVGILYVHLWWIHRHARDLTGILEIWHGSVILSYRKKHERDLNSETNDLRCMWQSICLDVVSLLQSCPKHLSVIILVLRRNACKDSKLTKYKSVAHNPIAHWTYNTIYNIYSHNLYNCGCSQFLLWKSRLLSHDLKICRCRS